MLLRGLTESLPEIFPLLYTVSGLLELIVTFNSYVSLLILSFPSYQLLERHFGAALAEAARQQLDMAKLHATTITATLNAVNAYAEWAPLPDLAKHGIIHGYALRVIFFS